MRSRLRLPASHRSAGPVPRVLPHRLVEMVIVDDFNLKPIALFLKSRVGRSKKSQEARAGHQRDGAQVPVGVRLTEHIDIALVSSWPAIDANGKAPSPKRVFARKHSRPAIKAAINADDLLGVDPFGGREVLGGRGNQRKRGFPISTAPANLLIKAVERLRHAGMDDAAGMGIVDAKPKSGSADNDIERAVTPLTDDLFAFGRGQFCREPYARAESRHRSGGYATHWLQKLRSHRALPAVAHDEAPR